MKETIKPYKKDFGYSYTSGAHATIELIKTRPDLAEAVYVHSDFYRPEEILALCERKNIASKIDDAVFRKINQKENSYVLGVFRKVSSAIGQNAPHVVLVNPSDMGNLGTVVRTLVGFNIRNLAVITPAADIWNPKTVRASMGALFHMSFQHFENIDEYRGAFPNHQIFTFMLDGELELRPNAIPKQQLFSLVFGNEATGLGDDFRQIGTSIKILQSALVDSLNLSAAVALGAYMFTL